MPVPSLTSSSATSGHSRRLALLVEDSVVNRRLLQFMLKHEGFDVVIANNGQEALEAFKQQTFDVVVMDIQMPVMDGLEATRLMRQYESESESESGQSTPIIAVTAGMDRGSCISAGMDAYLEKPVQVPDFHRVLSQVCPTKGNLPVENGA